MSEPSNDRPATAAAAAADDATLHVAEQIIGRLLRVGVIVSLALLLVGTALSFYHGRYGHTRDDVARLVVGAERGPQTEHAILHGLHDWHGQAFVIAGLLALILTPIARVAVSVVTFAIDRDWTFVAITSIVLVVLALSFVTGKVHG